MRDFVSETGMGMVFQNTADGPRVAHVPLLWDGDDRILFHLANGNALTRNLANDSMLCVVNGPDAYISPDFYGLEDQVPTWNYVAVELEGRAKKLDRDALVKMINDLSHFHESRLAPKPIWTSEKISAGLFDKMLGAITGFAMDIKAWRGTAKLSQNKPESARLHAAKALDGQGRKAMAHIMRTLPQVKS